jgi:hypothetical protein
MADIAARANVSRLLGTASYVLLQQTGFQLDLFQSVFDEVEHVDDPT